MTYKQRYLLVASSLLVAFSILFAKFFHVQILQHDKWVSTAKRQHFYETKIPFKRGRFFTSPLLFGKQTGQSYCLAFDRKVYGIHADCRAIDKNLHSQVKELISTNLNITPEQADKVVNELQRSSRNRRLVADLSVNDKMKMAPLISSFLKTNHLPSNALFFQHHYQRQHPLGTMLGSILHTVRKGRDELTGEAIPTGGLELSLNSLLNGKLGRMERMRSPSNVMEAEAVVVEPVNGVDVELTVNALAQSVLDQELRKAVRQREARGGWGVMMDPFTGAILALSQVPEFDPDNYVQFYMDKSLQDATKVKAVSDAYEPGSVMKPLCLSLSLLANQELIGEGQSPIFDPAEIIPTGNGSFPGRRKPMKDTHYHKKLDMNMAIQKSSNIYAARIMQRLIENKGGPWVRSQLRDIFGFSIKTGIEIPGESAGLLPTPGKLHPNGKLEWSKATPYSLAIGHNLMVNSIQLCRALSVIANRGFLVTPHIVKKIGNEKVELKSAEQVLPKDVCERVIEAMRYVVAPGGESSRAWVPGYTSVGKTGTARKIVDGLYSTKHHVASYIGFAPVDQPKFVLLVALDEPRVKYIPGQGHNNHGSVAAAPIFGQVASMMFRLASIEPDDPCGWPLGDPRRDIDRMIWAKETKLLKEKYQRYNN